jgi:primosomal protein N'
LSGLFRRSEEGRVYGLTYIDHQTVSVCNGSDLGKEYAAKRMLEKLGIEQNREPGKELQREPKKTQQPEQRQQKQSPGISGQQVAQGKELPPGNGWLKGLENALEQVMQPEETNEQLAYELREEQKRKRKQLKNKIRSGWVNIINGFRGTLIMGLPGSGKTFFLVENIIKQQIKKGYALLIYDFKYPDLTTVAYNHWLLNRHRYLVPPAFYVLNFDQPIHWKFNRVIG